MKNKLEIAGRSVTVDIDNMSKGLCDMHNEDQDMKAVLAFGMLDAGLCDMFKRHLTEKIKKEFSPEANEIFKERIKDFIQYVNNEVTKGVYKYAKLIV